VAEYTVRSGDNLAKIAAAHGIATGALIRANPQIEDPRLIFARQVIHIPEPVSSRPGDDEAPIEAGDVYLVRSGDTFRRIATLYRLSTKQLIDANPQIPNPDLLHPGDRLNVPAIDPRIPVRPVTSPPRPGGRAWFALAQREMDTGVDELPGADRHNPRIVEYHQSTSLLATDDETPWCSSFVNWCFEQAGIHGTNSARARSWETWGQQLRKPRRGSVTVFWRETKASGKGHVAFFFEEKAERVLVLGGNQDNQVNIKSYPKTQLLSYRWPPP
jgi:uncharacterized protein (TIGR02594 family)